MPFVIDVACPVAAELERIVLEQLDAAHALLVEPQDDVHDALHEARRAIRRIRATLQLLQPLLGSKLADAARPYRDAGRLLSTLRDAQSVIEGVQRLAKRRPGLVSAQAGEALITRLKRRRDAALRRHDGAMTDAAQLLVAARVDVASWVEGADHAMLWQGVRRGYARAGRAMWRARRERTEERLHRWRQRTRDHWLQLDLVSGIWSAVVGAQAAAAHRLAQRLGSERDLLLVAQWLATSRRTGDGQAADRALAKALDAERDAMLANAFAAGARVFAERPRALARRFADYSEARLAHA